MESLFRVEIRPSGKTYSGRYYTKSLVSTMTEDQYKKCFGDLKYYNECFNRKKKVSIYKMIICNVIQIGDYDTCLIKYDNKPFVIIDKYNEIDWTYELNFYKDKLRKKYIRAKKVNYTFSQNEIEILNEIESARHVADLSDDVKHKFNHIYII